MSNKTDEKTKRLHSKIGILKDLYTHQIHSKRKIKN